MRYTTIKNVKTLVSTSLLYFFIYNLSSVFEKIIPYLCLTNQLYLFAIKPFPIPYFDLFSGQDSLCQDFYKKNILH